MPSQDFDKKVVVITGGASGIGKAMALELINQGAKVVLFDIQEDLLAETVAELSHHGNCQGHLCNVTDLKQVKTLIGQVWKEFGGIDLFFNNAGIMVVGSMEVHDPEDIRRQIDVNLQGVTNGLLAIYPKMIAKGQGHIINTASVAGMFAPHDLPVYGMTKAGVIALSQSMRAEAKSKGVTISILSPGTVRTPLIDRGGRYGKAYGMNQEVALKMAELLMPISAESFAKTAVAGVAKKRFHIVVPRYWKLLLYILDVLGPFLRGPVTNLVYFVSSRRLKSLQKKYGEPTS